ncbi:protein Mis18-alpha-like [Antedon mediterranea]|uniref:protein Mis18-alpha-like n=1 Tax=Antedon mediterranea TaxID=105859 RepID=UPI003AF769FB
MDGRSLEEEGSTISEKEEYPIVIVCLKCGNILGDSCSWICANNDLKTITMRRVTKVVEIEQDLITSEKGVDIGSTYQKLFCVCDEMIGRIYQTTPRALDNLRDVFTLDINKIQSYHIGSGEKTAGVDTDSIIDLPSARSLQDDLYKVKATICSLNKRIINIENVLKSDDTDQEEKPQEKMEDDVVTETGKARGFTSYEGMPDFDVNNSKKLGKSPARVKRKRTR